MPSIIIELHDGCLDPIQLQTPPEKTAAKVLDACSRKFNSGVGSLSPKGKPNLLLEDDDVVAGGVTYVFTPSAGSQLGSPKVCTTFFMSCLRLTHKTLCRSFGSVSL